MILHTAQVVKIGTWLEGSEIILNGMRNQIANTAYTKNLEIGNEVVEVIHLRHTDTGKWVTAKPHNATHVKATIEAEASHP